ncbi:PAS domain-containing protein [Echinicola shivajiensis]|uniref:PAS domain-containing protein n=1 Tax=Echinicola shivajiensis TaxID=1035916 RepID=UPI001BFC3FFB|nr:PAS domain-containing protein [Echinicola shivajiensis]
MEANFFLGLVLLHQLPMLLSFLGVFLVGVNIFFIILAVSKTKRISGNYTIFSMVFLALIAQIDMLFLSLGFSQMIFFNRYLELLLGAVLLQFIMGIYDQQAKYPISFFLNYGFMVFLILSSLSIGGSESIAINFQIEGEQFTFDILYLGFCLQITIALIYSLIYILKGNEFNSIRKISIILNLGLGLFLWVYLFGDSLPTEVSSFSIKAFSFGILGFTGLWSMHEKGRVDVKRNLGMGHLLENFRGPVLLISSKGDVVNLNSKAKTFFGIINGKALPHVVDIVSSSEEQNRFDRKCRQILLGSPNNQFSFVGKKLSGEVGRIRAQGQLLQGIAKEVYLLLFLEDVLPLMSKESTVDGFDEVYEPLSKVSSEALWQYDIKKDKLYLGEGFRNLFGMDLESGKVNMEYVKSKVHPEDREMVFDKLDQLVLDLDKNNWENEYRFLKESGEYAQVKSRGYVLRDAKGRPIKLLGALKDVTNKYTYFKKIETQNAHFREIIQMQSHDVREPLTRIMAVASFILENGYSDLEEKEALRIIASSCQELDKVIHQVVEKVERAHIDL